jgi:hypothetical protein
LDRLSDAPALLDAHEREQQQQRAREDEQQHQSSSSRPPRHAKTVADRRAAPAQPPAPGPLVALRGRVACANPRACELDRGARAAIHEVVEEDIYLSRGAAGGLVRAPFETRRELAEREWWLEDGSGGVRVEGGRAASRLADALEVRQEYRERQEDGPSSSASAEGGAPSSLPSSGPSSSPPHPHSHPHPHHPNPIGVVQATLGWTLGQLFTGQRHQGTRKTERYLPVGAVVTVCGELARGFGSGQATTATTTATTTAAATAPLLAVVVRRPASGGPFYISSLGPRQLHQALAANARTCRALAACLGVAGCVMLARKAARTLWLRHRQRQARARVLRAEVARERRLQAASAARREARRQRRKEDEDDDKESAAGRTATSKLVSGLENDDDDASSSSDDGGDRPGDTCVVCLAASSSHVYVRCGHLCCCAQCAASLDRCPICRARGASIRVYRT